MNRGINHTSVQSIAVKADNSAADYDREETVEDNWSVIVTPDESNGEAKISDETQCAIYLDMKDLLWDAAKLSSAL